jgi:hypothetical protein
VFCGDKDDEDGMGGTGGFRPIFECSCCCIWNAEERERVQEEVRAISGIIRFQFLPITLTCTHTLTHTTCVYIFREASTYFGFYSGIYLTPYLIFLEVNYKYFIYFIFL